MDADTTALLGFFRARIDEIEAAARDASGGTVVGEPGDWKPAPGGDEWEVHADLRDGDRGRDGDLDILVALRPGLPRPPEVTAGYWGAVISWNRDLADRDAWVPEPQFRHIARNDPATTLRDVESDRRLLAELEGAAGNRGGGEWTDSSAGYADGMEAGLLLAVKIRAERFSTHRDYRPGWVSL